MRRDADRTAHRCWRAGRNRHHAWPGRNPHRRASSDRASTRAADLDAVLADVTNHWDETLGTMQVKTPDRSMDLMLNRWLLYQTLSCRIWGAHGVLSGKWRLWFPRPVAGRHGALCLAPRPCARTHPARRSPPVRRRRCAALVAARNRQGHAHAHLRRPCLACLCRRRIMSRSRAIRRSWTNRFPFLEGPVLKDGEHEAFFQPSQRDKTASLYEHCARAS